MKKRLAAIAAISLAMFQGLSVVGALPAQAAAPSVVSDDCYVTAGTLFAFGDGDVATILGLSATIEEDGSSGKTADILSPDAGAVSVGDTVRFTSFTGSFDTTAPNTAALNTSTDYTVVSATASSFQLDGFTSNPKIGVTTTVTGVFTLTQENPPPGDVTLSYSDGVVTCDVDGDETDFDLSVTAEAFADVVVAAEGDFVMELNDGANAAEWPALDSVRISAHDVQLDASGVTDVRDDIAATMADDAFEVGDVSAEIRYATSLTFKGGDGDDTLDAEDATLDVTGWGNDGDDVLKSGEGEDSLRGDAGTDKLFGGDGDDSLDCSDGSDTVDDSDQCWGNDGDDEIDADNETGTNGGDTVAPGDGEDSIDNAAALYYGDSSEAIEVDLTESADVMSDAGDDEVTGTIDAYIGSGEDDSLTGDNNANAFIGGGGDDAIAGLDGADYLAGGGGDDDIFGGGGADTLIGNGGADTIYGGADADYVKGGAGDDVMYGVDGPDQLRGGKGADQAWGGRGSDTCLAEVRDHCELGKIN
ncbi:MAG: calcium-binding protein [Actinomycetota bacterium]